ncbi:MAG: guanylate kinase [Clostridia bacterium]|nr:guanylate kinase [Clostridia bacterium]
MKKGLVFVISGPSGSGKGTIVEVLRKMAPNVGLAVSATTRAPRPGEAEGVNYYYKTRPEFESLLAAGEILEYTEYSGNLYGTLKSEAEKVIGAGRDLILEIEVEGGAQVKRLLGDDCVLIMLLAPDAAEQERRLRDRGTEQEETIRMRMQKARSEIAVAGDYDYLVLNETGKQEECAENLLAILKSAHLNYPRMRHITDHYFD